MAEKIMPSLKRGLRENLPAEIKNGAIYVTTDERAVYFDIDDSTRIRIGDFQEFATLEGLKANENPSTTALYYVDELNALAKFNGTEYIQINLDTGAIAAKTEGEGNAFTGVSYDPDTRTLTFTAGETFTTEADVNRQIASKVGNLVLGEETFSTVKEYVDKKTDGIATDTALETLTQRVTTTENALSTLNGGKTEAGSIAKQITDAIAEIIADAPDAFDTLKEISDWIASHTDSASAMNSKILANEEAIGALEGTQHSHENGEVLGGITAEDVAAWGDAESNAKAYADGLAGNYDESGAANDALEQAKEYVDNALAWGTF